MSSPLYVHSVLCFEGKSVAVRFCQENESKKWKFFDAELNALKGVIEADLSSFPKETLLPYPSGDLLGTKSEIAGTLIVKDFSTNGAFIKVALKSIASKLTLNSGKKSTKPVVKPTSSGGKLIFSVIVQANTKYNPETRQFEPQQFSAEIEAKSALHARKIAKEDYAFELGTEPSEITILKCVLKDS